MTRKRLSWQPVREETEGLRNKTGNILTKEKVNKTQCYSVGWLLAKILNITNNI